MSPAEIDAARKLVETYSAAGAREMPRVLTAALDALAAAEARAEKAEATIAEAWATLPPDRVRLLAGMGITLAEHITDVTEWREHERACADAAEAERDAARGVAQLAAEERDAAERMALAADIRSLRAGAAAWMQRRLVDAYRDERDRMRVERDALRRQLGRAQDELDAYRDERRGRATP